MLIYILFIIGFVILIKGADLLVEGASAIGKKIGVSDLVIGLTIVSFGTSAPELVVNVAASLNESPDLAIGNIFGSNISNILLILGLVALIYPIKVQKDTVLIEIPFSLSSALLVGFLANASLLIHPQVHMLGRFDGIVLLFFFLLFMMYVYKISKDKPEVDESVAEMSLLKSVVYVALGMLGLFFGGEWVVAGALEISIKFGFSESFVGLSIVSIGTSLPELVASAIAAFKKKSDIAIGNIVGSNIFNMLWVLGLSAIINPLPFNSQNNIDLLVIVAASTLLILCIAIGRQYIINRPIGIIFILSYFAYIIYIYIRG